jgi:hypothetical protein
MWPRLAPHELVHDLLGAKPLLAAAGRGILGADELSSLHRPRSRSLEEVPWTAADAALVDEARTLLGPRNGRRTRSRGDVADRARARAEAGFWPSGLDASPLPSEPAPAADTEEIRSYGHIVVDEVQDLSPMQLRMVARRSLSGSMTVVGDIAQATGPWAPDDWGAVGRRLSPQREARFVELTVSYRTPAEVAEVAAPVLAVAAPGVAPPLPVRRSGSVPSFVTVPPASLLERIGDVAEDEARRVAPGRTAVLVPDGLFAEVLAALGARGLHVVDPRDAAGEGLAAPLVILPSGQANGLEFDAVVVVEPGLIASGGLEAPDEAPPPVTTRGLRTLYVALTRPTRRLVVVHSRPLPAVLRAPAPSPAS